MSDDNLKRLVRILAIDTLDEFDINDYIEIDGLSDEEIEDLSLIIKEMVGDQDA